MGIIRMRIYESPFGILLLGSSGDRLCLCDWQTEKHHGSVRRRLERLMCAGFEPGTSEVLGAAARQLDEYFAGRRRAFDMPLLLAGTDFQRRSGAAHRYAEGCPCGRQCQRRESSFGFRPLPPRNRQRPFPDWLRRRNRGQAQAARAGRCPLQAMTSFFVSLKPVMLFYGGESTDDRKACPARLA